MKENNDKYKVTKDTFSTIEKFGTCPAGPKGDKGDKGDQGSNGSIDYSVRPDFVLGNKTSPERGDVGFGRAMVRDGGSKLAINYERDFKGGVRVHGPMLTSWGFGPYLIKLDANDGVCLDYGQFGSGGKGAMKCDPGNGNHYWYIDPVMGRIFSSNDGGKCLQSDGTTWSMADCNSSNRLQRFAFDHGFLRGSDGRCLDVGQTTRSNAICTDNKNTYQNIMTIPIF